MNRLFSIFKCLIRIFIFSVLISFWFPLNCQGQQDFGNLTKTISLTPPSPNASALGEYGKTPVGLATGTPQIAVPLYTLKTQNIECPISLNYSTNGVKVDQIASRTGVDWVLNAGGVITRTVYGRPDELTSWLTFPADIAGQSIPRTKEMYRYLDYAGEISNGAPLGQDTQPDLFIYNFNGYTGKFTLDSFRNIVLIPQNDLKIEKQFSSDGWNFRITTPDGIKYYFGGHDASETTTNVPSNGICEAHYVQPSKTAWYLKKIVHPKGDSINFSYGPLECKYVTGISQTFTRVIEDRQVCGDGIKCTGVWSEQTCLDQIRVLGHYLSGIRTSAGGRCWRRRIIIRLD